MFGDPASAYRYGVPHGTGGSHFPAGGTCSRLPGCNGYRDRVILTTEQMGAVAALARVGMQGKIYPRYIARKDGVVVGRAYIDTHTAKTERPESSCLA
ncbi:MAG: hypothetical protein Ct9H300mP25_11700 [Acidobacteriota bacterium]|nr:MAG: hypothetical protein Ct9H300mP25_11700 [Acidobacteriota bacterium]